MSDLKNLRQVILYFTNDYHTYCPHPTKHIVMETDVQMLVDASVKLHYMPGINPHNKVDTARLWEITVAKLGAFKTFWWSQPSLGLEKFSPGAMVSHWEEKSIWSHPKLKLMRENASSEYLIHERD